MPITTLIALLLSAVEGSIKLINALKEQADRNNEWTPAERAQIEERLNAATSSISWQQQTVVEAVAEDVVETTPKKIVKKK